MVELRVVRTDRLAGGRVANPPVVNRTRDGNDLDRAPHEDIQKVLEPYPTSLFGLSPEEASNRLENEPLLMLCYPKK
jgi:hypothetical protein